MADRLPLRKALDEYKITPETLCVSFYMFAPGGTRSPERELRHGFSLSYPGPEGAQALIKSNQEDFRDGTYLGCFSLAGLEVLWDNLCSRLDEGNRPLSSSVASFLRIKKDYVIVVKRDDEDRVECVSAFTFEAAMSSARKAFPGAVISFGGELSDLDALIKEMRALCVSQDFMGISFDQREVVSGWCVGKLLTGKRDPGFVPVMERFEEGDV